MFFVQFFIGCELVVKAFVYMMCVDGSMCTACVAMLPVCTHAHVNGGFCPPSQLPPETNQAESCQAAGQVGTESVAELLALAICSFKVSLTSHETLFLQRNVLYHVLWLRLKCSYPPKILML